MVDARWLDIIEKFEGIEALRPAISVDGSGQSNANLPHKAAPSNRRKLVFAFSGVMVVVFLLVMIFLAT